MNGSIVTLDMLEPGTIAMIKSIEAKGDLKLRLIEMGLVQGKKIKVIREAPLSDPIEIRIAGYSLLLRRDEAKKVEVKICGCRCPKKHRKGWRFGWRRRQR